MTSPTPAKTILLVEDDPPIRQLVRRVLEQRGYVLIEARNAEEALHLAEERPDPIDLLMTDVVLPHMDGFELAARFRARRPETRVLLISGYAADSVAVRGGLKESGEQFLLKPFTKDQLVRKIHKVLESPVSGGAAAEPGTSR